MSSQLVTSAATGDGDFGHAFFHLHLQGGAAFFGNLLPVAAQQRAFQRIQHIEAGPETGALAAQEGFDRTGGNQIFLRTDAHLPQPGGGFRPDVLQLHTHAIDSR